MHIFPDVKVERFEQLAPGDLFLYLGDDTPCVAIKAARPANGDRSGIAFLGPAFPHGLTGPRLVPWEGVTCLSFGSSYRVLLPTKPSAWSQQPPPEEILCLARTTDHLYVRVNGENFGRGFFPCYVEFATGAVIERSLALAGTAAYATEWEIVAQDGEQSRSILKFPFG